MHVEIQVALNFVISYLYNKLPRRRVNLFGEELEKALKEKFVGHWYPEKPFKGSAFRCLKTGDPTDAVLDRAARESGVPIADILENLPAELAVWIDPGEVSYRIGEKGLVKILYSETNEHHEDSSNDREVTKTFNPEAQCFQPIEAVSSSMNGLSLSPKGSPPCTASPTSESSPTFIKNGVIAVNGNAVNGNCPVNVNVNTNTNIGNITVGNNNCGSSNASAGSTGSGGNNPTSPAPAAGGAFLQRSQAPLTFTTATFAQTKFGSTKLKTNSKRANRMSPTEFSNYIKQRAMQQQLHHSHGGVHLGPSSPSRSLSPNPLALGLPNDPYFFQNVNMGMYGPPAFNGSGGGGNGGQQPRNMFDSPQFHHDTNNMCGPNKFNGSYLEPHNFYNNVSVQQNISGGGGGGGGGSVLPNIGANGSSGGNIGINQTASVTPVSSPGSNPDNAKLLDGLNSFYSNPGPYQHLLVAN